MQICSRYTMNDVFRHIYLNDCIEFTRLLIIMTEIALKASIDI